jgi:hypothetical protein
MNSALWIAAVLVVGLIGLNIWSFRRWRRLSAEARRRLDDDVEKHRQDYSF